MTTLRLLPKFLASLLLLPVATLSGCTPEVRQYGGGGAGGAGNSSSSSSSSSGGMQCTMDADCGANSECQSFGCVDGICKVNFSSMGTAVALQEMGDCQSKVCDGKGYIVDAPDDNDAADDGNPCTLDACANGQTQHAFVMAGMPCNGSKFCDGFGYCVECLDNSQCPTGICAQNNCATAACSDNLKNGTETDIDCGGSQCPPCAAGYACIGLKDCKSNVCSNGKCLAPTCGDKVANGQETSIDCGGPDCMPCAAGSACNAAIDCQSHVCVSNVCASPTCNDGVMNGTESDIDCGGTMCTKCILGRGCFANSDCKSSHCCPSGDPGVPGYCEMLGQICAVLRTDITQ